MKNKFTIAVAISLLQVGLCARASTPSLSTIDGATYNNITMQRIDPDGLYIEYTLAGGGLGMSKVKFARLSDDQRKQFGYDATKAKDYELQCAKATADWRAEATRMEQEGRALMATRAAQSTQDEMVNTEHLRALAQLKQAEADLTRSTTGSDNYGGAYGGGGYDLIGTPQIGRAPRARTDYAPIVTPVPFPRINTSNHSR